MPKLNHTPWGKHVAQWINCQRCPLCKVRKNVVLARGSIPADVLLIGEGPGESEDVIGQPFVGPAGKLLDNLIEQALMSVQSTEGEPTIRIAWTNIVACIPKSEETKRKNAEPLPKEIDACAPRLEELISLAKPKLIIAVGDVAAKEGKRRGWDKIAKVVHIIHPARLLRLDVSQLGLQVQRCRIQLTDALASLVENQ